jgi:hypothetical protein
VQLVGHAPWQKLVNAIDFVIGDMSQHIVQVSTRPDVVQRTSADQRVLTFVLFAVPPKE